MSESIAALSFSRATDGASDSRIPPCRECKPGEGLVAELLLVREAAPPQDATAVREHLRGELAAEARLSDSGRPQHRDQVRAQLRHTAAPGGPHEVELARTTNERRLGGNTLGGRHRLDRNPRADGILLALRQDRPEGFVTDRLPARPIRLVAHDEPAFRCGRLQPRRGVDDVTGRERFPGRGIERDDGLASVHGGASSEAESVRAVQLLDAFENAQPRADGSLGVVAVRARGSEDGHHGVPDELLEHAPVLLDPLLRLGVVELQLVADVLGIGPFRPGSEADEIDEEHRHELSLLRGGGASWSRAPQLLQKRASAGTTTPQLGQGDDSMRSSNVTTGQVFRSRPDLPTPASADAREVAVSARRRGRGRSRGRPPQARRAGCRSARPRRPPNAWRGRARR